LHKKNLIKNQPFPFLVFFTGVLSLLLLELEELAVPFFCAAAAALSASILARTDRPMANMLAIVEFKKKDEPTKSLESSFFRLFTIHQILLFRTHALTSCPALWSFLNL
jgi:hypothetical protein